VRQGVLLFEVQLVYQTVGGAPRSHYFELAGDD
jgi:hypothetical protein